MPKFVRARDRPGNDAGKTKARKQDNASRKARNDLIRETSPERLPDRRPAKREYEDAYRANKRAYMTEQDKEDLREYRNASAKRQREKRRAAKQEEANDEEDTDEAEYTDEVADTENELEDLDDLL